jgi:Tol biopolymer transport system component
VGTGAEWSTVGVALSTFGVAATVGLLVGCAAPADDADATAGGASAAAFVAPLDTDILIAEVTAGTNGLPAIGAPTNLTQRPDYDNQPSFVPDGSGLWYTVNSPQEGQADIWRYDFADGRVTRVTQSAPESEYSAAALPDGSGISTIRVEADSMQRLWRFDADGTNGSVLLPALAPVGYHAWVDANTVVMFVLGQPPTLRRGDLRTQRVETIAENIGRSIQRIPNSSDISFVQLDYEGGAMIMRLPGDGGPPTALVERVGTGQDHAWTPSGTLLMADRGIVYAWRPGQATPWTSVGDFSDLHIVISRLAVSPDGRQIAMVAEVEPIELPSG